MAEKDKAELIAFLEPFAPAIRSVALKLREWVWELYPDSVELIYDGPAALAFGWTPSGRTSDTFCSIAIYNNDCVQFGFYNGALLKDPKHLLEGGGKQYRFVSVTDLEKFRRDDVLKLVEEAYENSIAKAKGLEKAERGGTFVRGRSEKKRRPQT